MNERTYTSENRKASGFLLEDVSNQYNDCVEGIQPVMTYTKSHAN